MIDVASDRVVIVGGAGFLGTALARRFGQGGHRVLVADLAERLAAAADRLQGIETAILDFPDLTGIERVLEGADVLVHLACTSTPASSMVSFARDVADNIVPSVDLFEKAGKAGVPRVIFASSGGTVYGTPVSLPVSEDAAGNPLSGYGASKLAIENYLSLAAARDGFTGISMRIGNPYGSFQLRGAAIGVIANYLSRVRRGEAPEVWGDGGIVRDYIHIDDVADAFLEALEVPDLASGAYNIGSGVGVSINTIWEMIRAVTGTDLSLQYRQSRSFDVAAIVLDIARFRAATGWAPRIDLHDGITGLWNTLGPGR